MYGFLLSKEDIGLAKAEVEALVGCGGKLDENFLLLDHDDVNGLEKRLAYTNFILKVLFECNKKVLLENVERFDLHKHYKENFCVRVVGKGYTEKELADAVYHKLRDPKVELEDPKTRFVFVLTEKKAYLCVALAEVEKSFELRKAHKRPRLYPVSLHPKLARCCVNLTGVKLKEEILDPFCGTGGILLEAGLMGLKAAGFDIDDGMLEMSRENLEFFGVKDFKLEKMDARCFAGKYKHIVTDLPYGKNTKSVDLFRLYSDFLANVEDKLLHRAVIIFPSDFNHKDLLSKFKKLHLMAEFNYYVHKSMSKKIVVVSAKR